MTEPLMHTLVVGWRPFLDPIDIHRSWFLMLLPMSFLISMAYKAVRLPDLDTYWRSVLVMTMQIIVGMIALGLGFFILIQYVLPRIAP